MSAPLLDLDGLKALFQKGMAYARKKFSSPFYSVNKRLCDYQLVLANSATNLTQFMNAVWMSNQTFASAFDDPHLVCDGCEMKYTAVQFGVGNIGWYFIYGVAGNYVYNITFFRVEVAPPSIVATVTQDKSEAVRWFVMGGYGKVGGPFYNIQNEAIYMKYTQPSYSTFSLTGAGDTISATFASNYPMQFTCDVTFLDAQTNAPHSISITLAANTRPLKNFPGACDCGPGAGTFYYSYTDVNTTITEAPSTVGGIENPGGSGIGKGWIDHQLMKSGPLSGWYLPALMTVDAVLKPRKSSGWVWFSIIDQQSGIQYMLIHGLTDFYANEIKVGDNITPGLVNVYKEGVAYISPTDSDMDYRDTRIELTDTFLANGVNLPAGYKITLPGGKKTVAKMASSPNVYPAALAPSENPGYLYDETGTEIIGIVLLEANLYMTNEELARRSITFSGGDATDTNAVNVVVEGMTNPQTGWQKTLAFLTVLYPLWIIAIALFFIFKCNWKDKQTRALVALAIILLAIAISSVRSTDPVVLR